MGNKTKKVKSEATRENVYKWAKEYYEYEHSVENTEDLLKFDELDSNEKSNYIYWLKWRLIKRLEIMTNIYLDKYKHGTPPVDLYEIYKVLQCAAEVEKESQKAKQKSNDEKLAKKDANKYIENQIKEYIEINFSEKDKKLWENKEIRAYVIRNYKINLIKDQYEEELENISNKLNELNSSESYDNKTNDEINKLSEKRELLNKKIKKIDTESVRIIQNKIQDRLKMIDKNEIIIYTIILKIMDNRNYPNINLLRRLENDEWEIISKEHREILYDCVKFIYNHSNWEDIDFNIDMVKDKFLNPVKYRIQKQLEFINDVISILPQYDLPQEEIDSFLNQVIKKTSKIYKQVKKNYNENQDLHVNMQLEQTLNEIVSEKAATSTNPEV